MRAQGLPAGGHDAWLVTGQRVDLLDHLAGGAGRGHREVPDLPGGPGRGAEGDQACGDVGGVGVAVRLVRVAHHLGGLAGERRTEDRLPSAERVAPGPK